MAFFETFTPKAMNFNGPGMGNFPFFWFLAAYPVDQRGWHTHVVVFGISGEGWWLHAVVHFSRFSRFVDKGGSALLWWLFVLLRIFLFNLAVVSFYLLLICIRA